jgi:hypothetical protein
MSSLSQRKGKDATDTRPKTGGNPEEFPRFEGTQWTAVH